MRPVDFCLCLHSLQVTNPCKCWLIESFLDNRSCNKQVVGVVGEGSDSCRLGIRLLFAFSDNKRKGKKLTLPTFVSS